MIRDVGWGFIAGVICGTRKSGICACAHPADSLTGSSSGTGLLGRSARKRLSFVCDL